MLPFKTYAKNLQWAMKEHNPQGRTMMIREVADAAGYKYEHIRKAYNGQAALGQEANDRVCQILGLDAAEMWMLAQKEKYQQKMGNTPDPLLEKIVTLWTQMDSKEQQQLVTVAQELSGQAA